MATLELGQLIKSEVTLFGSITGEAVSGNSEVFSGTPGSQYYLKRSGQVTLGNWYVKAWV